MRHTLTPRTRRLLDIQGFEDVDGHELAPRRGLPTRFGCGLGAILVLVTAGAFRAGHDLIGYALGGALTFVVLLVSTTDICIPSLIYRSMFGWPRARETRPGRDPRITVGSS
jgi:hypothetical protein